MKAYIHLIFILGFILFIACNKEATQNEPIELRSDFTESEFKAAIIGDWQSVFVNEGQKNVIYLSLTEQNKATITISDGSIIESFNGTYSVSFIRPPLKGNVTLAEITIKTTQKDITLTRVDFSSHNGVPLKFGLFLRIYESPYGTLERKN